MRKNKTIIIGMVLIVLGGLGFFGGILYTLTLPKIYRSTSTLAVEFSGAETQQYTEGALIALTRQKAELVKIRDVIDPVIIEQNLTKKWGWEGAPIPHDVAFKILFDCVDAVADDKAAGLIRISVSRKNPNEASALANAISSSYQASQDEISIVEKATPDCSPVSPKLLRNLLVSLIQAVVFAGVGALMLFAGKKKTVNKNKLTRQPIRIDHANR